MATLNTVVILKRGNSKYSCHFETWQL